VKKTILLFGLLAMSLAQAEEIKVMELSHYEISGGYVRPQFAINEELGRAWVEVTVSQLHPDGDGEVGMYRTQVPGLSYDKVNETINLEIEGRLVECATLKESGRFVFRSKVLKETSCKLDTRWKKVSYDDGFEIKTTKKLEIFLTVE
jgi:hypothetical protein